MKRSTVLPFLLVSVISLAQDSPLLYDKPETEMRRAQDRQLFPTLYRTIGVDVAALRDFLDTAPDEEQTPPLFSDVIFQVPAPDGSYEAFRIVEYVMMQPGLAARYPEIGTYRGVSVDNAYRTIRFDWTAKGFSAVISGGGEKFMIDPYAKRNQEDYISYYRKDYPGTGEQFTCLFENEKPAERPADDVERISGDCTFQSYRFAVACRGEYSNFHDAFGPEDSDTVMAAVVIATNRVNEVYERDVAVRLVLIDNTDEVFYYDAGTDPYSGGCSSLLSQNQSTMSSVIGSANYDVGHLFGTGGGGCASLSVPCTNSKARGQTGLNEPIGDVFWIDYVSHEIGHQFGGNHTQNNSCARHFDTAFEPGSASTIMGYAGICNPNVQDNSDDYFHGISVQEINNFTSNGNGDNCDDPVTPWNNTAPVVTPGPNYTIPRSTPFMLTAVATDGDEDPLTYCWEQWDNEVGSMPPSPTNTQGPMFRSFDPSPSPTRYFPRLEDLVDNVSPTWEVLPSVSRTMEFRVTVRDFHNGLAGCTDEDNLVVTVSGSAGPFAVTAPNNPSVAWTGGETESVTWNVAGTSSGTVDCDFVDIMISYDGGLTYPDTLVAGVSNDGAHNVTAPAMTTTAARVMVKCSDNIFFDISNADFEIVGGAPDYTLESPDTAQTVCISDTAQFEIDVLSLFGYNDPVTLTLLGAPPDMVHMFSVNPVVPGTNTMLSLYNLDALPIATYLLTVEGVSAAGTKELNLSLQLSDVLDAVALSEPQDYAEEVSLTPLLTWVSDPMADTYDVEIATDIQFSNVVSSASVTNPEYMLPDELSPLTSYFWRVRSTSNCAGLWSEARTFQTLLCATIMSTDVPIVIPPIGGGSFISVSSRISVPDLGTIVDVNALDITGTHSEVSELIFELNNAQGVATTLASNICPNATAFDFGFDDEALAGPVPCPPTTGLLYQPEGSLSTFDGSGAGFWRLIITDQQPASGGGSLDTWGLRVCVTDFECDKVVVNTNDNGPGSLRAALACAENGDTITFDPVVIGQTIVLQSPLEIVKDLFVSSSVAESITIDGSALDHALVIPAGAMSEMAGLTIVAGMGIQGAAITNDGTLLLRDITVLSDPGDQDPVYNSGALTLEGACNVSQ